MLNRTDPFKFSKYVSSLSFEKTIGILGRILGFTSQHSVVLFQTPAGDCYSRAPAGSLLDVDPYGSFFITHTHTHTSLNSVSLVRSPLTEITQSAWSKFELGGFRSDRFRLFRCLLHGFTILLGLSESVLGWKITFASVICETPILSFLVHKLLLTCRLFSKHFERLNWFYHSLASPCTYNIHIIQFVITTSWFPFFALTVPLRQENDIRDSSVSSCLSGKSTTFTMGPIAYDSRLIYVTWKAIKLVSGWTTMCLCVCLSAHVRVRVYTRACSSIHVYLFRSDQIWPHRPNSTRSNPAELNSSRFLVR